MCILTHIMYTYTSIYACIQTYMYISCIYALCMYMYACYRHTCMYVCMYGCMYVIRLSTTTGDDSVNSMSHQFLLNYIDCRYLISLSRLNAVVIAFNRYYFFQELNTGSTRSE